MNSSTSTLQRNLTFDESRRQNKSPVSLCSIFHIGSAGTAKQQTEKLICHQRLTGVDNIRISISKVEYDLRGKLHDFSCGFNAYHFCKHDSFAIRKENKFFRETLPGKPESENKCQISTRDNLLRQK
jgi:hypothetical protein